jgi:anti-sigma regulatory factor (Ser/Thr protein kinase)
MSIEPLDLAFPRDAGELAWLRATLGGWLDRADVNNHDRDEIILAVHEAVANGIEHSNGDGELRVRAEMDDGATVTVTSPGPWRQPGRLGRGYGLAIMRSLSEVEIDATTTSAHVRMRRRLRS